MASDSKYTPPGGRELKCGRVSLGDDGRPGVKYVNGENRVEFGEVKLLSVSTDGAWVTGLPDEIRLITRGGGFVSTGEQVVPVDAAEDRG